MLACSNADYEEIAKARFEAEDREAQAEEAMADGTLFGGNLTQQQGKLGPAYRPKVRRQPASRRHAFVQCSKSDWSWHVKCSAVWQAMCHITSAAWQSGTI